MTKMTGHGPDQPSRPVKPTRGARRIYWLRSRKVATRRPVQDAKSRAALTCSGRLKVLPKSKLKSRTISLRHSQNIKEINEAFNLLSDILPPEISFNDIETNNSDMRSHTSQSSGSSNSSRSSSIASNNNSNNTGVTMNKLTRVATLRQATSYIKALSDLLNNTHISESQSVPSPASDDNNNSDLNQDEKQENDSEPKDNIRLIYNDIPLSDIEIQGTAYKSNSSKAKNDSSTICFITPNKKIKIACDPSSDIKR